MILCGACSSAPFTARSIDFSDAGERSRIRETFRDLIEIVHPVDFEVFVESEGPKSHFKVYLFSPACGKHFMIDIRFVLPQNGTERGRRVVAPNCHIVSDAEQRRELTRMGTVRETGRELYHNVIEVMTDFGQYHAWFNNCRTFGFRYLLAIEIPQYNINQVWKDGDRCREFFGYVYYELKRHLPCLLGIPHARDPGPSIQFDDTMTYFNDNSG
ncbi:uncharacterized protein LOC144436548 isoform X1 [Glandiceps talaboti]